MNAEIITNRLLNNKFGYMELRCPQIAAERTAGRFFMISVRTDPLSIEPILKRPFAISSIISKDVFSFIYMIVGRGTALLSKCREGETISVTGPLGNHFNLLENSKVALAAGGIGIAPMINTAKKLKEKGNHVTLYYGGRTATDILLQEELTEICDEFVPVTEDGSLGKQGFVTIPFKEDVKKYQKVYACGPNRMLMAISDICVEHQVDIEVSLDENMACGVGACLGCLINIKDGSNTIQKRCCVDGPVFNGKVVDWQALCR